MTDAKLEGVEDKHEDASSHGQMVEVTINQSEVKIPKGDYTTDQLKAALNVSPSLALDIVENGVFRTLTASEITKVKKGMEFVSHVIQGGSA